MAYVVLLAQILMVCVIGWMFWPLLLAAAVGVACGVGCWKGLRGWPAMQRRMAAAAAIRMGARMAAVLLGWAVGLGVLLALPIAAYDPSLLTMAGAATAALLAFGSVWLLGQICTSVQQARQRQPVCDRLPGEGWWLAGGTGGLAVFVVALFMAPDMAGWIAWREQLLGYPSVQLRIPLAAAATPAQRLQQQQALLVWVQPLLEQGNRSIERSLRGKHGTNHYQAVVPSRYRWQGDVLEVALGRYLRKEQLEVYVQHLQAPPPQGLTAMMGWWSIAQTACWPREASPVGGLRPAQRNALHRCVHQRLATWQESASVLAGQIGAIDVQFQPRFSPWRWGTDWQ